MPALSRLSAQTAGVTLPLATAGKRSNQRRRSRSGPTLRWRWPVALLAAALALALGAARADAQPGLAYAATPPTYGALYQDGPNDRWLLGGTWLQRADPANAGMSAGWYRNVGSTAGWSTVGVPNSFNAGDLSTASMNGSVEWYRRDFTVPRGAFASYVPARFRTWIIRFESVNYYATVWLNGRRIGTHAGAYLPFEFALKGVGTQTGPPVKYGTSMLTPLTDPSLTATNTLNTDAHYLAHKNTGNTLLGTYAVTPEVKLIALGLNRTSVRAATAAGLRLISSSHFLRSESFGKLEQYLPSGPGLF